MPLLLRQRTTNVEPRGHLTLAISSQGENAIPACRPTIRIRAL